MPHTETFNVSSKNKEITRSQDNSYYYWRGEGKGTIDMQIEVFGYNHEEEVSKIYKALKDAGLENRYFNIKVSVKS